MLSARNHERPSAVGYGSVTTPGGRSDYGRTRVSLGANVLVDDPFSKTKRNFMDDLQTQRKRLHYPLAMTKTSSDFGKLMVPASSFAQAQYRPQGNSGSQVLRNNNETPFNGNWTLKRVEPSSLATPAGMRIPKMIDSFEGLPEVKDTVQTRYNP